MTRWDWVTTINRVTWVQANWNGKHKHKHHSVTALECSRACSESRIMSEIVETNRRTGGHAGRHWQSHTADQMVQKCEKHQKKSRQQWENWFLWRRMQLNYYNTRKTAAQLNHSKILVYNEPENNHVGWKKGWLFPLWPPFLRNVCIRAICSNLHKFVCEITLKLKLS